MFCVFVFFFFKQKTAYEMRISDWSSDVCSSDLVGAHWDATGFTRKTLSRPSALLQDHGVTWRGEPAFDDHRRRHCVQRRRIATPAPALGAVEREPLRRLDRTRSEEHTSELQSLMRISYAVFCLKKKKKNKKQTQKHVKYKQRKQNTNTREIYRSMRN